jgi:hypothetical protein
MAAWTTAMSFGVVVHVSRLPFSIDRRPIT